MLESSLTGTSDCGAAGGAAGDAVCGLCAKVGDTRDGSAGAVGGAGAVGCAGAADGADAAGGAGAAGGACATDGAGVACGAGVAGGAGTGVPVRLDDAKTNVSCSVSHMKTTATVEICIRN
ncbi:hypothetical protein FHG87_002137 [Trinorchestia longiramus]|nr:hypothetical protein FHG87_002137 [Trinorchestia longiramus]